MTLTTEQLQQIRARAEKATSIFPSPWQYDDTFGHSHGNYSINSQQPGLPADDPDAWGWIADVGSYGADDLGPFIAAASTDIPALLEDLVRCRELLSGAMEYARHSEGCSAGIDPSYRCRCRWSDEGTEIRAYLDAVRGEGPTGS